MRGLGLWLVVTLPWLAPAAQSQPCRLALALAFDVSRSVDGRDYDIQREGLLAALADPGIRGAFLRGDPVALAVYEWSGARHQEMVADWRLVLSAADLDRVAAEIAAHRRWPVGLPTATGAALAFGHDLLARAPACRAQVIDISGDGQSNDGPEPDRITAGWDDGITVNALAIGEHEIGLVDYLHRKVVRGPGAFVEYAARHTDFPPAIRRKLWRELTEPVFGRPRPPVPGLSFPAPRG
ncbi:MAG TPA: DUF1194 domain-containing protein [Paracoccaceae bacterium]|nr:DUF1194 domain-containing protein [Paracoccaceae bacterium]HMO70536.1 DUF1194 domain-containing protein [Paracoccaceae bacterium]